jgi:transaldolase
MYIIFFSLYLYVTVYSVEDVVDNAKRIHANFKYLEPRFHPSRICIQTPATWEGIRACQILEREHIRTMATLVFTKE